MNILTHPPGFIFKLTIFSILTGFLVTSQSALAAKPNNPVCNIITVNFPNINDDAVNDPACDANVCVFTGGSVEYTGQVSSGTAPYTVLWEFIGGNPFEINDTIASSGGSSTKSSVYNAVGSFSTRFSATDSAGKAKTCADTLSVRVINSDTGGGGTGETSINSTAANGNNPQRPPVVEQAFLSTTGFTVIGINDLGMHCADLDSRVLSILPPFNVLHAVAIKKGTGTTQSTLPRLLDNTQVDVVYSAASNPLDPVLNPANPPLLSILANGDVYKTNFWDINPSRPTGNILGYDLYDAFYPDTVLDFYNTPNSVDLGLPVPDLFELYFGPDGIPNSGDESLVADIARNPGINNPYIANDVQHFDRFDTTLPFFTGFPFGYTLQNLNWFAADGIPLAFADDKGRENAYPLMRIQAIAKAGNSLGVNAGTVLASVDTVTPISIESDCKGCHLSTLDGGNGEAACIPGMDSNCPVEGSKTSRSGASFDVVSPEDDPDANTTRLMSEEWAADMNIVRLHDSLHGTNLEAVLPVSCQTCHYTPALDLAQVGPSADNGREQLNHKSFSNVLHKSHGEHLDLFPIMPAPGTASTEQRFQVMEQTCYGCHPGSRNQCLRGAMFAGDILCQDCHGDMPQIGNDFSDNFPVNPFPSGADLTKRVPWASEPGCQSCHVGDAVNQPADKTGFIYAPDGIRLLRAWRSGDPDAKPIKVASSRFAEDYDPVNGNTVLYRLSKGGDPIENSIGKKGHGGVFCEACHGSTHAEWPVTPRSGPFVANDNATATQLQGHDGKIQECDVCHERDAAGNLTMPLGLQGPHGLHPVNDNRWNHEHRNFTGGKLANCRTCHGQDLTGTVLSMTSAARVLDCKNTTGSFPDCAAGKLTASVPAGTVIGCGNCHKQK
ncbi:MAG TPA: cytochrome C [Gammaproteobacteria bacterium]